jgi:hypothetical protein
MKTKYKPADSRQITSQFLEGSEGFEPNIQLQVGACDLLICHPTLIVNLAAESILMINILAMSGKVQFLAPTRHFDEMRYTF